MRTKEQRRQENADYLKRQKAKGIINTSFMMPAAIRSDVMRYIKSRAMEYALRQSKA